MSCEHRTLVNGRDEIGTFCLDCDEHAKKIIPYLRDEARRSARIAMLLRQTIETAERHGNDRVSLEWLQRIVANGEAGT